MTDPRKALLEYLRKLGLGLQPDFLREAIRVMSELLMELEVSQQIGAERYERSEQRTTQRNGYRARTWDTRVGEIDLRIPKLRQGSYSPSLLEPRRRAEQALLAVVQQAYIEGVSQKGVRGVPSCRRASSPSRMDCTSITRFRCDRASCPLPPVIRTAARRLISMIDFAGERQPESIPPQATRDSGAKRQAKRSKWERRVPWGFFPSNQASRRTILSATAVKTCCTWVFRSPR